jgi:alkylation response protein AidB-like acyl-CoA dehydrogenase
MTPEERTARILRDETTAELLDAHTVSGASHDTALWRALCRADVVEECLASGDLGAVRGVLREVAAHLAPVPAFVTLTFGGALARHGTSRQREQLLGPVLTGDGVVTGAVHQLLSSPTTTATFEGDSYCLRGQATAVPYAGQSTAILIPARVDNVVSIFVVDPRAGHVAPRPPQNGEPWSLLALEGGLPGHLVGDEQTDQSLATIRVFAGAALTGVFLGLLDRLVPMDVRALTAVERLEAACGDQSVLVTECLAARRTIEELVQSHKKGCAGAFCTVGRVLAWNAHYAQQIVML